MTILDNIVSILQTVLLTKKTNNTYKPDHSYKIIIIGGSESGKTNTLLNLKKEQDYHDAIDKIYLYARDLSEPKYQFLIKNREDAE